MKRATDSVVICCVALIRHYHGSEFYSKIFSRTLPNWLVLPRCLQLRLMCNEKVELRIYEVRRPCWFKHGRKWDKSVSVKRKLFDSIKTGKSKVFPSQPISVLTPSGIQQGTSHAARQRGEKFNLSFWDIARFLRVIFTGKFLIENGNCREDNLIVQFSLLNCVFLKKSFWVPKHDPAGQESAH